MPHTADQKTEIDEVGEPLRIFMVEERLLSKSITDECSCQPHMCSLSAMPEEILEHILEFLSPYNDMDSAKLVSKQWNRVIKSVISQSKRKFHQKLTSGVVKWFLLSKDINSQGLANKQYVSFISERHSHSAAYYDGSMYVFGGCTSTNTTFNDLWKFDLTTRQWIRPVAMGTYPSPKACATMVVYKGNLVLFGGWSHPVPYPNPHQSAHFFSELHSYSPVTNRWSHILSLGQEPEALGGHSASVAGHLMVIFGGSPRTGLGTNNIWVFNFQKASWKLQPVASDFKPEPRYGQYQTTLDENHILIVGGSVGQNRVFNDVWMLSLHPTDPWTWIKITVEHPEHAPPHSWCHGACRVKDSIVVVAKANKQRHSRNTRTYYMSPRIATSPKSQHTLAEGFDLYVFPRSEPLQCANGFQPLQQNKSESCANVSSMAESACNTVEDRGNTLGNQNLLSLQQKLHRECINLPDPDNHHHNPTSLEQNECEGSILRLSNKWGSTDHHNTHQQSPHHQLTDQPQHGSLHKGTPRCRVPGHMPSIRPNATCNRQKQLEALLRQEEILRNKSRALAASRNKPPEVEAGIEDTEPLPDIVATKNKMDVHVLDLSRVFSEQVVEWKPLPSLQPSGAPTETVCCTLLEGRSELLLFGGVVRDMKSPASTNTAVNKLYILQAS